MKKILSLVLAISLCLSAVILLASCTGKSAYEVAVENGFVGTETEWLESLKGEVGEAGATGKAGETGTEGYPGLPGKPGLSPHELLQFNENYQKTVEEWLASLKGSDAKDGHTPVVTVDTNGYWVIDGTRQPVKVDGSKAAVTSLELAQSVFTVVKSGTAPTLQIKIKLDDGSEDILPVSNSVIADASYDLTKEGVYPVTINYGGKTTEATITVEGLMVYYANFDSLTNTATMADICAETGIKIPAIGLDSPRTG
ncbi:MAG: collagen-like protein, partial [Clostridia bacterium]|nr:collagen-like protein [Clostridia bacterium]